MQPVLANLNRMSISLHPDTSESPAMAESPDAGAGQARLLAFDGVIE
jgi:hypothetical protein